MKRPDCQLADDLKPRRHRDVRLRKKFCVAVLVAVVGVSTSGMAKDTPDVELKHGGLEFLEQSLVQSPVSARLLAAAAAQLETGDRDLAFAALSKIFAEPHDTFLPVQTGRPSASTWSAAFELLRTADYATRAAWTTTAEPLARKELNDALTSGDVQQLRDVSLRFPFTQSAFTAEASQIVLAATNGQHVLAAARLKHLQHNYGRTRLGFPTQRTLAVLQHQLQLHPAAAAEVGLSKIAGTPASQPRELTQPWPDALWSWRESVWHQPQFAAALAGSSLPEHHGALRTNSWQPVLANDILYVRTPLRVAAFEKLSGQLKWSVATDTLQPVAPFNVQSSYLSGFQRFIVDNLLKMDGLGMLAVDDEYVIFTDHYRNLVPVEHTIERKKPFVGSRPGGGRLVAVRLKPSPHIAWTVGDAPPHEYQVDDHLQIRTSAATQNAKLSEAVETDNDDFGFPVADPVGEAHPFRNQAFLGVPLIHDGRLFVLSADNEVIWLSCLAESTGRIEWAKPLLYQHGSDLGRRGSFMMQRRSVVGASVCGMDGSTLVSALNHGVVVGTNVLDGRLLWATNLRDEPVDIRSRHELLMMAAQDAIAGVNSRPLINDGKLFWTTARSSHVYCVDTQTGDILWRVGRNVVGVGAQEGSSDCYATAVTARHLVMIGERHIRVLDVADGRQLWTQPLQPQTGRATCNGAVCLVPQQDGTVASFDVTTGEPLLSVERVFADDSPSALGTLVADKDVICAATPVSVRILPTTRYRIRQSEANDAPLDALTAAQLDLLSFRTQDGLQKLKAALQTSQQSSATTSDASQQAADLLAETLLSLMGRIQYEAQSGLHKVLPSDATEQLNRLPLTVEQAIRYQILAPETADPVAVASVRRLPLLRMLPDWSARADVVAWTTLSHRHASQIAPFDTAGRHHFRRIEQAIVFPEQLGSVSQQIEFAQTLRNSQRLAAADQLLLAALQTSNEADRRLLNSELQKLRSRQLSRESDTANHHETKPRHRATIDERLSLTHGATGLLDRDALSLVGNRAIGSILAAAGSPVDTPAWYSGRLFIAGENLHRVDLETGAVGSPQPLPGYVRALPVEDSFGSPSLIPLISVPSRDEGSGSQTQQDNPATDGVGVISLIEPATPRVLWWKRLQLDASDRSPLQVGPLGPGYMMVASSESLQCLHPFTGNVLWNRKLSLPARPVSIFPRSARVVGDENVIAVLGETHRTCERFRTKDGGRMESLTLNLPREQKLMISGRRLLFTRNDALVLLDLFSGKNLLEGQPDIKVLAATGARQLADHRVVVVTPEQEIVVFNMQSAAIELRCSVDDSLKQRPGGGLNVFERNGRLFVEVRHTSHRLNRRNARSLIGEPRLDGGTLFCVDRRSGKLEWSSAMQPSIVPTVFGDPTDLMVTWAYENPARPGWEHNFGGQLQIDRGNLMAARVSRWLTIQIIDGTTGRIIAERKHLTPSEPLRCVHTAADRTIRIETAISEILVRYE